MSSKLESKASYEATFFGFLSRQITKPKPLPADTKLTNQIAIVTGSNVGLGVEASRQLLSLGLSHLVMGVRSQAKGDTAAEQLRAAFPSATTSVWILDLVSYDSVMAFEEKCATLPRIDIAILNAGTIYLEHTLLPTTKHEATLQVNYLSTVLLAILLLPLLKAKKTPSAPRPPVISIVGSDAAHGQKLDTKRPVLEQLSDKKTYSSFQWYAKTKLLLIFFLIKLVEHVASDDVIVNVSNPAMTKGTDFFRETSTVVKMLIRLTQYWLARSLSVGASLCVDAVVGQGRESHGSFTGEWTIKPYPKWVYSAEGQEVGEKLWEETLNEFDLASARRIVEGMKG